MKKKTKNLIFAMVLLLLLITAFLCSYVSGRTVAKLFSEYENYEVTIIKASSIGVIDSETVLTADQKEMLMDLFRETSFSRVTASTIHCTIRYEIRINGTRKSKNGDIINGVLLLAQSTEVKYFLISGGEFNGKLLKIHNNQWDARIDEIIALSEVAATDISIARQPSGFVESAAVAK